MRHWAITFIAIGLGAVIGFISPQLGCYIKPVGTAYLQLLGMLIIPLVFSSMIVGITNIPDTRKLGTIGATTLLLYFFTTLAAVGIGLGLSRIYPLGTELQLVSEGVISPAASLSISDVFLSLIPQNPIRAFAEQNVLQVIIFSVFFGIALNFSGEKGQPFVAIVESLAHVMQKLTSLVLLVTPFGVFALMANATASMGLAVLVPVISFLLLYYAGCCIHFFVVLCGLVRAAKLPVKPFIVGVREAFATAISTCSSSACLPVSLTTATENLGISNRLASFVLPLGCSLNMNGSALFQTMGALFIANCYGIELSFMQLTTLVMTVLLATIGTASIPGAGFMMLSIVFSSIGLPLEGLALLAGIDRLRDMGTTSLNVLGDLACALFVAQTEKAVDSAVYQAEEIRT
jgi:Na+/H+-dicarboxylate symporter